MRLTQVIVVIVSLQLYAVTKGNDLPRLLSGNVATSRDNRIPGSTDVNCSVANIQVYTGKVERNLQLDQVLNTQTFGTYQVTARVTTSYGYPRIEGHMEKFSFAEVKTYCNPTPKTSVEKSRMYALQVNPQGMSAYWLPQGGTIDIPGRPAAGQPRYVFTPDFSGCAWTVTPLNNGNLRLRHVQAGHEDAEFNNLTIKQKGGLNTYALQYLDYGFFKTSGNILESIRAFAYMHFTGNAWKLHVQRQACAPTLGNVKLTKGKLTSVLLQDWASIFYKQIVGTDEYRVPLL